jgi:hypothetical protein
VIGVGIYLGKEPINILRILKDGNVEFAIRLKREIVADKLKITYYFVDNGYEF